MKNKLYSSLMLLIIFGGIAKLLSTVARITTTRIIGVEGMSIYSLVVPIMSFVISLAQMGLPTAITKLVSSDYKNRGKSICFFLCRKVRKPENITSTAFPAVCRRKFRNSCSALCRD